MLKRAVDPRKRKVHARTRMHPFVEWAISLKWSERYGSTQEAPTAGQILETCKELAQIAKPIRGAPASTFVRFHVHALVALVHDTCGEPARPVTKKNGIYDSHMTSAGGDVIATFFREVDPRVPLVKLVDIIREANRSGILVGKRFEDIFPVEVLRRTMEAGQFVPLLSDEQHAQPLFPLFLAWPPACRSWAAPVRGACPMNHLSNRPRIEMMARGALHPDPTNPRTHPEKQLTLLARSIRRLGFLVPIVIDNNDRVVAGHARWLAADRLGMAELPCVRARFLSERDRRAFALAENRLSELGGWDEKKLAAELDYLFEQDYDRGITGFVFLDLADPLDAAAGGARLRDHRRGGRLATSIGGTLTGRGGDIIIIDDPIKPDEAMSDIVRSAVNDWFFSMLASRLNDKRRGAIVTVMQRLYQYDLAGMLIETGGVGSPLAARDRDRGMPRPAHPRAGAPAPGGRGAPPGP